MIVTFETAVKLKAAGLPQPEPQRGQAWYFETWRQYHDGREQELVWDAQWLRNNMHEGEGERVFAPTATDILREFFEVVTLEPQHTPNPFRQGPIWDCMYLKSGGGKNKVWSSHQHENPAEACAFAWLEKNTK